jgi:hypothetical protein
VLECLLCKHEGLSSNPAHKKKKELCTCLLGAITQPTSRGMENLHSAAQSVRYGLLHSSSSSCPCCLLPPQLLPASSLLTLSFDPTVTAVPRLLGWTGCQSHVLSAPISWGLGRWGASGAPWLETGPLRSAPGGLVVGREEWQSP